MPAVPRPPERQDPVEEQGLATKWWDSDETQPIPVMREPAEKREPAGVRALPEEPEDWWDPGWQAVQSPGAVPLRREILQAAVTTAREVPAASPASWGQVLGNTFSLWTERHLRWLRGSPGQRRGRLAATVALAAGLVAVAIGAGGLVTASVSATPAVKVARPAPIAAPTEQTAVPAVSQPAVTAGEAARVARPVWVSIPAIGIRKTSLIHLGLTKSGTLQVPKTTTVAGWFTGGPRPGAVGSAVIAGHVDSHTGPGIFFWLRALRPGDKVYVGRADGTMAIFTVFREHMYAKDRFPTEAVYGAVPDAELRLITCGGIFDHATGSYLSNVVVFARLTS
jgi:hypothetical protein